MENIKAKVIELLYYIDDEELDIYLDKEYYMTAYNVNSSIAYEEYYQLSEKHKKHKTISLKFINSRDGEI